MKDKGVYEPKRFILLGVLFSALVPIYISAANWGSAGRNRARYLWLGGGALGFILIVSLANLLPSALEELTRAGVSAVSGYIAHRLSKSQRPLYEASLRLGAQRRSLFKGSVLGLGYTVGAMGIFAVMFQGVTQVQMEHGKHLLRQKRFAEAATVFQRELHWYHDNREAVFDLAFCQTVLGQYDEAAAGFEQFLRQNDRNAMAYAVLSMIRREQGRLSEADSLDARARALDPKIFDVFNAKGGRPAGASEDDSSAGP
jgi:tetratricopeptide (TPR) repeat protein